MESKVNYTVVGLFVIILIAAIAFSIIWLSAGITGKEYNVYRVYMNESVTGLSVDAPVKYNGVDVGTVKEMKLNPANPQQVELLLNIEEGTPITNSTVATLSIQGLTGVAYIDLKSKGNDTTPLVAKPGEKYPTIKTAPSLLLRLDTAISDFTTNFNQLSTDLRALLNAENREAVRQTLANLNQLTRTLANNTKQLDAIMQNTAKASQQLPNLVTNSQDTLEILDTQTIPVTNQVLNNLQGITNNLLEVSQKIKQNPAVLLRGQAPSPPGPGEK